MREALLGNRSHCRERGRRVGLGIGILIASPSPSQTKTDINYQSVGAQNGKQSGIKTGDGGFQVEVGGTTALKGGVISSTQAAVDAEKNSLTSAGDIRLEDIQNTAAYSAKGSGFTLGVGSSLGASSAGVGSESGNGSSTTQAGISGLVGNTAARTSDAETGLTPIFNKDKVKTEVGDQVAASAAFGREGSQAWGTYSTQQERQARQNAASAQNSPDGTHEGKTQAQWQQEEANWREGGAYRVLGHTAIGGITGGGAGAVGAGVVATTAPVLDNVQASLTQQFINNGMDPRTAEDTARAITGGAAALLGGAAGGSAGAVTGLNVDSFNRQLHPSEKNAIKLAAKGDPEKEARLLKAACYEVKCWAQYTEGSDQYNANYVSAAEAAFLTNESLWLKDQRVSTGMFSYSTTDHLSDGVKANVLPVARGGVKLVGGGLAIATGTTICTTSAAGCAVGAPLAAFGASEATEGGTALYNHFTGAGSGGYNPLRIGSNTLFPGWGDLVYDASYLGLSILTLGAAVPLKVGPSDGINRANSIFGVTVPRWQNPVINPLTNNVLLTQPAAQGVLLYGVGTKVPAVVEGVNNAPGSR